VLPRFLADLPIRQITRDDAPSDGVLALIGTYFPCGDWLEKAAFERVVICHNLTEQYPSLMQRLVQIEQNPAHPQVALTFPSELFKATTGLPGRVEYPFVDTDLFRRGKPPTLGAHLVIGRHGRAYPLKFHPNDPSFFRALMARGHKVRILGGTIIANAFARETEETRPELLALGAEQPRDFLENLDVFIYRKHPELFETGGTVILEAMAMALPVIVFRERCGCAELIEHGQNGFLVDDETQAIELVDHLAVDHALREQMGHAARATIVELMRKQDSALIEYYLGLPESSADPMPARA
jgi:hypothetical protein